MSLTLSSPGLDSAELTRLADPGITRRLRGINGVAAVNLAGAVERELVVELRPRDLQASGVSVGQVVQALQLQNLAVPVGRLEGELDERTIRLRGRLDQADRVQGRHRHADRRPHRAAGRRGRREGRDRGATHRSRSSTTTRPSASTS